MFLRNVGLALMAISCVWAWVAVFTAHYAWTFYEKVSPKNDMRPVWTALLLGSSSIVMASGIFVANRVVRIKAVEAFETEHGAFIKADHRLTEPCVFLTHMQTLAFCAMVMWLIFSSMATYDSFMVEGKDYKILSVFAHFLNSVAAVASLYSIWFSYIDAEVVYILYLATLPNEVQSDADGFDQELAGPYLNDVQRGVIGGQQIPLQEINPAAAPSGSASAPDTTTGKKSVKFSIP